MQQTQERFVVPLVEMTLHTLVRNDTEYFLSYTELKV
jgi:hypothetical protein